MAVYMDHNATSQIRPQVLDRLEDLNLFLIGNASSLHAAGQEARKHLEAARKTIASVIDCKREEVYFTSGGTESNNIAVLGRMLTSGISGTDALVISTIEHPSVRRAAEHWSILHRAVYAEGGRLMCLGVTTKGCVNTANIEPQFKLIAAGGGKPAMLCIMHSNNETGIIQPVQKAAHIAKHWGVTMHVDACQTLGKIPVNVQRLGAGTMSMSSHKIGGPKGIGALYIREGVSITPLMFGGHQERDLRPGTENVAGAVGFALALEEAMSTRLDDAEGLNDLRRILVDGINSRIPDLVCNTIWPDVLPHVYNVSFPGADSDVLVSMLSDKGIYVSDGSACEAGQQGASKTLLAMGRSEEEASSALRFSLGWSSTEEDVDEVLVVLPGIVEAARKVNAY